MRRLVDITVVLTAGAIAGAVGYMHLERVREEERVVAAADQVRRFDLEIKRRAATGTAELNGRGWPVTVDPSWFGGDPPKNPMLRGSRPWVEVASPGQAFQKHPEVRIVLDDALASFWYNPSQGIIRARVPGTLSDQRALEAYNRVNGVSLASIFEGEHEPRKAAQPGAESPIEGEDAAERGDAPPPLAQQGAGG